LETTVSGLISLFLEGYEMQLSYSNTNAVGLAGMIADNGPRDVLSRANPSVEIPYGVAVTKGTTDKDVKLPTTSPEAVAMLGVAIISNDIPNTAYGTAPKYPVKSAVSVMRKGRVWVKVEEAVTAGDQAFVRFATGTGTILGSFRKSADTATAVAIPGTRYLTSASANGLAIVDLTLA
jgi:hypothetical protein